MKYVIILLIFLYPINTMAKIQVATKQKFQKAASKINYSQRPSGLSKRELASQKLKTKKTNFKFESNADKKRRKGMENESKHLDKVQAQRVKLGVNPYEEMINFKK